MPISLSKLVSPLSHPIDMCHWEAHQSLHILQKPPTLCHQEYESCAMTGALEVRGWRSPALWVPGIQIQHRCIVHWLHIDTITAEKNDSVPNSTSTEVAKGWLHSTSNCQFLPALLQGSSIPSWFFPSLVFLFQEHYLTRKLSRCPMHSDKPFSIVHRSLLTDKTSCKQNPQMQYFLATTLRGSFGTIPHHPVALNCKTHCTYTHSLLNRLIDWLNDA